jgi:hypothetical protein
MAAEDIAAATAAAAAAEAAAAAAAGVDLVTVGTSPRGEPIILILAPLGRKKHFKLLIKKDYSCICKLLHQNLAVWKFRIQKKLPGKFRNFRKRKSVACPENVINRAIYSHAFRAVFKIRIRMFLSLLDPDLDLDLDPSINFINKQKDYLLTR